MDQVRVDEVIALRVLVKQLQEENEKLKTELQHFRPGKLIQEEVTPDCSSYPNCHPTCGGNCC